MHRKEDTMKLEVTLTDRRAEMLLYLYEQSSKEITLTEYAETLLSDAIRAKHNYYKEKEAQ